MPMTREAYERKRQARYERLLAAAEKADREGKALTNQAHDMSSIIPLGQPILVGHYSEGRDRRYRDRIHNKYRKGFELQEKADYYRERAESAKNNDAIFSDDPDAAEKIEDKIEKLQKRQDLMKAANKLIRKKDLAGLAALGFSETRIADLFKPDFCGRIGFADFEITNNGANIRRLKERLKIIEAHANDESSEKELYGITITDNVEENRLQLTFPGKPAEDVRHELKSSGFRWSPTNGVWQSYRGAYNAQRAQQIITKYYGSKEA